LGYPPIAVPESLKEWKVAITSVGQGYKSTKGQHDYRTDMSGLKMIDFKFYFIFFSIFILFSIYFHFLFLEL